MPRVVRSKASDHERLRQIQRVAYGLAEAAEAAGVSETFLTRPVQSGELPSFRWGRRRLIMASDLIAFLEKMKVAQLSQGGEESHGCQTCHQPQ